MFAYHAPPLVDDAGATRFVEALSELPAELWCRPEAEEVWSNRAVAAAADVAMRIAREMRLEVELWRLSDAVETAIWYAIPQAVERRPSDSHSRAAAVARLGSVAVLLRSRLTPAEFGALYGPFRGFIPASRLALVR